MDTQADEYFQAQAHFYKHVLNYIGSMSLKCATQLGIPDIIHSHGKPITLSELALALQIDEAKASCMYRLMRVLVHSGFFAKVDKDGGEGVGEAYTLTPFSRILVKDKINCLSPFAMAMLHPVLMTPWQFLGDWMQGNKQQRPFESVHGKPIAEYMEHDDPEFKTIMHDALGTDSQMMNLVVKDCKPVFEGLGSLVDVGGGTGKLARVISEAYPHMSCTVLDLPYVVDNLPSTENLKFVGGDLFQHIPSADAILMKQVLHMFEDEDCIKVLKKSREAVSTQSTKGKVIIIDVVINEKKDKHEVTEAKLFFDLLMMVEASGKERSEKEWEKLLLAAGFSHYKITPLFGLKSIIEQVLHMFEDEDCIKVLKKCREAISTHSTKGKVIIIDVVINEKEDKHEVTEAKLFFDLLMMVEPSGKERSEKEWEKLLLAAGFSHYKITPLFGLKSIIEAYP